MMFSVLTVALMKRQKECGCKAQCHQVTYTPSLSYALLSKFSVDRVVLNDPARRARTQFVPEMGPGHQKCKAFLVQIKGIFPTKSHRFEVEYIVDLSFIF